MRRKPEIAEQPLNDLVASPVENVLQDCTTPCLPLRPSTTVSTNRVHVSLYHTKEEICGKSKFPIPCLISDAKGRNSLIAFRSFVCCSVIWCVSFGTNKRFRGLVPRFRAFRASSREVAREDVSRSVDEPPPTPAPLPLPLLLPAEGLASSPTREYVSRAVDSPPAAAPAAAAAESCAGRCCCSAEFKFFSQLSSELRVLFCHLVCVVRHQQTIPRSRATVSSTIPRSRATAVVRHQQTIPRSRATVSSISSIQS
jgi:hypothetical protein